MNNKFKELNNSYENKVKDENLLNQQYSDLIIEKDQILKDYNEVILAKEELASKALAEIQNSSAVIIEI